MTLDGGDARDLARRALAAWRSTFLVGNRAIASNAARRRAQAAAVRATARAIAADPTSLRLAALLSQVMLRGSLVPDRETAGALRDLLDAPWSTPALARALHPGLARFDEGLAARAVELVLADLAPQDRAHAAAELARPQAPSALLDDPSLSNRPVMAFALAASPVGAPTEGPAAKLGGEPALPPGAWPTCPRCGASMRFLVQLPAGQALPPSRGVLGERPRASGPRAARAASKGASSPLAAAPLALRRSRLISLFLCDDDRCEPWSLDGGNAVLLSPTGVPLERHAPPPHGVRPVEERPIEFLPFEDRPDEEDAPEVSFGSKVGGFPRYVQDDETPCCRACGLLMITVAQLAADLDDALLSGDRAMWYLSVCPAECTPTSAVAFRQSS